MSEWIRGFSNLKIKKMLSSNRGESLVESLVSLAVLTVLLVAIGLIIHTALRMTSISSVEATRTQEQVINPAISTEFGDDETGEITFSFRFGVGTPLINVTHDVKIYEEEGVIAFSPIDPAPDPEP